VNGENETVAEHARLVLELWQRGVAVEVIAAATGLPLDVVRRLLAVMRQRRRRGLRS
jgi:hypothetical protein